MGFSSASAAEMGLSKAEFEDAVNLEKLYFLANKHDQCAVCGRGGVSAVDTHRYEFLCAACSAGKTNAKKIGADRFSSFEVQKLQTKFGESSSRHAGAGGSGRSHRRSASPPKASERRRRHGRGHSRRRDTRDSPSPSSESPETSDDSPPRAAYASGKPRSSRSQKSSSKKRTSASGSQEDFAAGGWPQTNVWGAPSEGGGVGGPLMGPLPGMGGIAGMGLAAAAAAPPVQQQQQPGAMWAPGQQQQGLIPGLQQQPMPQQGAALAPFGDTTQQQWRGPGGLQPHQQMLPQQQLQQQLQPQTNAMYGMQQGAPPQQQQQPGFGIACSPLLGSSQVLMPQQQQNPVLQQLQQQQQRNPFASMRGPQQAPARLSNPFASMQGPPFASGPFQQQALQQQPLQQQPLQKQPLQQQPMHQQPLQALQPLQQQPLQQQPMGLQQMYRPAGLMQQPNAFGGFPSMGGPSAAPTNPFATNSQMNIGRLGGNAPFPSNSFNSSVW